MGIRQIRGHGEITAVLERRLAADPVRNTVVGSVLRSLAPDAWCAAGTGPSRRGRGAVGPHLPGAVDRRLASGRPGRTSPGLVTALPDLTGASGAIDAVAAVAKAGARRVAQRTDQRLFRIDRLVAPPGVPGRAVAAGAAERDLLLRFGEAFATEIGGSVTVTESWVDRAMRGQDRAWLWDDEGTVRFRGRSASRGRRQRADRAGVHSRPGAAVGAMLPRSRAAATRDILGEGAIPVLFTDLANPTSNGVYQRLGYYPVADYASVAFGTARITQSGSIGTVMPGSRPNRTARVIALVPNRSRTASSVPSSVANGRAPRAARADDLVVVQVGQRDADECDARPSG